MRRRGHAGRLAFRLHGSPPAHYSLSPQRVRGASSTKVHTDHSCGTGPAEEGVSLPSPPLPPSFPLLPLSYLCGSAFRPPSLSFRPPSSHRASPHPGPTGSPRAACGRLPDTCWGCMLEAPAPHVHTHKHIHIYIQHIHISLGDIQNLPTFWVWHFSAISTTFASMCKHVVT